MDKKSISIDIKKVILFIILIVLIIVVVQVIRSKTGTKEHLKELYSNLEKSQEYQFSMDDGQNKTVISKKGSSTAIDMYIGEEHTTTLVKDQNTYQILHDRKEYYTYEGNSADEQILLDELEPIVNTEHKNGKEKIQGKNYEYEEFEGISTFMNYTGLGINTENIKTRFYFKGKNLKFIKTIYDGEETLQKIDISYKVSQDLFEIPKDYAEN